MHLKKIRSDSRMHSAETLARDGNRLQLVMAIMILLVAVLLYAVLQYASYLLAGALGERFGEETSFVILGVYQILWIAVTLFLVLPSVMGFYDLAGRMSRGEDTVLADMLSPFSERKRYARALSLSWGVLWRIGLAILAIVITVYAMAWISEDAWGLGLLLIALIVMEVLLGLRALRRFFWMPYLVLEEGMSAKTARREIRTMKARGKRAERIFGRGWFWWLVLGFLSVGLLLLWEVLPRMTVAYFDYCREARKNEEEKTIRTEDSIS